MRLKLRPRPPDGLRVPPWHRRVLRRVASIAASVTAEMTTGGRGYRRAVFPWITPGWPSSAYLGRKATRSLPQDLSFL